MDYSTSITGIINQIDTVLEDLNIFEEVTTNVRLEQKNYLFPRADILIDRDELVDEIISMPHRLHRLTIRVIMAYKAYRQEDGLSNIIDLMGFVHDSIEDQRRLHLNDLVDDIWIHSTEYSYIVGQDNIMLYVANVLLYVDFRI
jgi:hypothetical protein